MVNAKMWPGSNTFQAIRATGPGLRGRSSLLLFTTDPLLCSIQILAPFYCWSYCSHIKAWVKVINALLLWPEQLKCRFYGRMPLNHGWEVMKEGKCTDQGHSHLVTSFCKVSCGNAECEKVSMIQIPCKFFVLYYKKICKTKGLLAARLAVVPKLRIFLSLLLLGSGRWGYA